MIFVAGDEAIYEGSAVGGAGGILVRGQMVTVVRPNEDEDDDVIVRKLGDGYATYPAQPADLNWRNGA